MDRVDRMVLGRAKNVRELKEDGRRAGYLKYEEE